MKSKPLSRLITEYGDGVIKQRKSNTMSKSKPHNAGSGGIGLACAVFIVFLVLKLTGYIDWSWWWITAPLWGGLVLAIAIFIIIFLFMLIFDKD
jgi:hypothetical protein